MAGVQSTTLASHLDEFMWRELHGKNGTTVINKILQHISLENTF